MKSSCSFLLVAIIWIIAGCQSRNSDLPVDQNVSPKNVTDSRSETSEADFIPSKTDNSKNNSLFVFVGEKLELTRLPYTPGDFDNAFLAKYKVLDKIYGDYLKDTIEFEVYDHHGDPAFAEYRFVLLFVSFDKGKFYHEKYQYFALYKTKDDKWASPYSAYDYQHEYNRNTPIKPVKIEFAEPVYYDVVETDKKFIRKWYPAPYFQVEKNKAKAVYGNYIPELFKLKRNGVLKARDLF